MGNFSLDPNLAVKPSATTAKIKQKPTTQETQGLSLDPNLSVTKEIAPQSKGVYQFTSNVVRNFPGSAKQFAKYFVQPFIHPVETYNAVKQIASGYKELIAYDKYISENPDSPKPPITDNMRAAQAVNEYFGDRYGDWTGADKDSWETRGKKVLATIERDPAGFLADISTVITIGGGGVNIAGRTTGTVGKVIKSVPEKLGREGGLVGATGQAIQDLGKATQDIGSTVMQTGDVVDPILGTIKGIKQAYKPIVMAASGSKDTFKAAEKAYDISKNQDFNATKELWKSMWDKTSWDEIVGGFNKKVSDYKKQIGESYSNWKTRIKGEKPTTGSFTSIDDISKQLDEIRDSIFDEQEIITRTQTGYDRVANKPIYSTAREKRYIKNLDATDAQVQAYEQILDVFNDYKNTPIEDLKANNILSLKQKLGKLRFEGTEINPFDNYLKDFNKLLESDLNKVDSNTSKVMSGYSDMADNLVDIKNIIGDSKRPQQQATKLSQLIKDSPRGEIGLKNIEDILKDIDNTTVPQITGQTLESPFNLRGALGAAIAGGASTIGIPQIGLLADPTIAATALASGLLASSPRALGSIGSGLGLASKYGVNLENFTRGGRIGRPFQQTADAPFPMDIQQMDWRIDPSLYQLPTVQTPDEDEIPTINIYGGNAR